MPMDNYTDLEREVIILKAVVDLIDDMVNFEIFERPASTKETILTFKTMSYLRLFNVLLVDMLSAPNYFGFPPIPPDASGSARTFLRHLQQISEDPLFNDTGTSIAEPVKAFANWLDSECFVEGVWLPSIQIETKLRMPRISFIKICGDIAKHSLPRMSTNADRIRKLLAENGHEVNVAEAYLAMPDFYQWFHHEIFNYHASTISEFLNNIRWGIYDYLRPEFVRSYVKPDATSPMYRFDYPRDCVNELPRALYWDLMNWARSEPFMPRFKGDRHLKGRY